MNNTYFSTIQSTTNLSVLSGEIINARFIGDAFSRFKFDTKYAFRGEGWHGKSVGTVNRSTVNRWLTVLGILDVDIRRSIYQATRKMEKAR